MLPSLLKGQAFIYLWSCRSSSSRVFLRRWYISILIAHTSLGRVSSRAGPGSHLWHRAPRITYSENPRTQESWIWIPAPSRLLILSLLRNLYGLGVPIYKVGIAWENFCSGVPKYLTWNQKAWVLEGVLCHGQQGSSLILASRDIWPCDFTWHSLL